MKKTVLLFFALISVLCTTVLPVQAQAVRHQWYCKHVGGHVQPSLDQRLSFIEAHNAYYVDRHHTDANADEKVIYLTFDAGYENGNVEKTLDVLKEEGVTAAFFILGHLVTNNASLVRRMADEGHTVCNHTAHHKNMSAWEKDAFLAELHALEALYREHIGKELHPYFRPPEGSFSEQNLICASENGYRTIFWSFAYPDWDNAKQMPAQKAKQMILENAHNGEVMLLHPTSSTNAEILGDVIRALKAQGYRFGTLDELTGRA